ncbi:hypothetical protein [Longirhabdus pacifica]|uniref:hypothetical protein n=1 Tax=Longirhabdus pacifica TaxID=2305227 RepID=UPI0010091BDA|nr:hypothetical protein [Longirhabdus pacifica]
MELSKIMTSKNEHMAKSLAYRWYSFYEREKTEETLQHQLDILADDVVIHSPSGTANSKQEYVENVMKLPNSHRNAHDVRSFQYNQLNDEQAELQIDIVYHNQDEHGALRAVKIHYDTELSILNGTWVFTEIKITPVEEIQIDAFHDTYVENRAQSFVHYWLYLMEACEGDATPFQKLLHESFHLDFSSTEPMTTYEQFASWFAQVPNQIKTSRHEIEHIQIDSGNPDEIHIEMIFNWNAITVSDQQMTAKTKHQWVLKENHEKFIRIVTANVEQLESFSVQE